MTMKMKNDYQYAGNDRWDWQVYLEGDDLADVEKVSYILHPTFSNPVRMVTDPKEGFRLRSNGWGTFEIKAVVDFKDGTKQNLVHELELEYPPDE